MFQQENVFTDIHITSQLDAFHFIADIVYEHGTITSKSEFIEALCKREEETTTGFGKHVAIPHARSKCVKSVEVIICRLDQKVEWNSLDGEGVNLVIALMTPENSGDEHLKLLSKLARMLIHDEFIEKLKKGNQLEIYEVIQEIIG